MREEKINEIVRQKEQVEKDLIAMNELKEEAFRVFGINSPLTLEQIKTSYDNGAWNKIIAWHLDAEKHEDLFFLRKPEAVRENFEKLTAAIINRTEFEENLSEAKEDVENYIKLLEDFLDELNNKLNMAYEEFVRSETGEYKWIFEQPFMRKILMKFLAF